MKSRLIAALLAVFATTAHAQDSLARFEAADKAVMATLWNSGYGPNRICAFNYVIRAKGAATADAYVRDLEAIASQVASYASLSDLMLATSRLPRNHGISFDDLTAMTAECGMGL